VDSNSSSAVKNLNFLTPSRFRKRFELNLHAALKTNSTARPSARMLNALPPIASGSPRTRAESSLVGVGA